MFRLTIFISSIVLLKCFNGQPKNDTEQSIKSGKVFSLFSVVQFPNDECTTTSGTYSNGTCITSSECSSRGGTAQGSCAAGFGVCCIYTYSATGSIVTQNVSYLVNPSYPSNYAPTSTPASVSYTIQKASCDICRIRLDYEAFQLTTPNTAAAVAATPNGECNTDYMTIKTTAHTVTTDATGNFGNYPYLCGKNPGQHNYIDVSCTCTDSATLSFTLGDSTDNLWKIKVTQLSCNDQDVSNTEGCLQYFTGLEGSFKSHAFDSNQQIIAQNYAYCIRPASGYCCIEYTPVTWDVYAGSQVSGTGPVTCVQAAAAITENCASAVTCTSNFVIIPGAQSPQYCNAAGSLCMSNENGFERYCGTILAPNGGVPAITTASSPITTCDRPFRFYYTTGGKTPGNGNPGTASTIFTSSVVPANANPGSAGAGFLGFSMTYRQLPGNC